ncbi:MAG: hypothetical protein H6810_04995 [Phycisphaeraceae bacterium]|nr:MAG: hypothetical protein H6810_04995 [Phycisphaeraceae bacterium]
MSDHNAHNLFPNGIPADAEGRAAAIRAAVDGELDPSEMDALRDGAFERRIAFEHGLRAAVGRAMVDVRIPEGLRDRVLAAARDPGIDRDEAEERLAERLEARADETRDRTFWVGRRPMVGAAAAVLLLALGWTFVSRIAGLGGAGGATAYSASLVQFVTDEHERTLDDSYAKQKYVYTAVDKAISELGGKLQHKPRIPTCGKHTKFRGAAPCGVPGKGPSAQFQFDLPNDEGPPTTVSIFVKQDHGELNLEDDAAYLLNTGHCGHKDAFACVWRRDGLLYTMVSKSCHEAACLGLLDSLGVRQPDPDHHL